MEFYQKIFASKYDSFMSELERTLYPIRKELISDLEGNILEVGSGTGTNFEHYNSKARVIALEPSSFMLEKSIAKIPQNKQITTCNMGVTDSRLDAIIEKNSLDYIICTLVLCSIPDQNSAFAQFRKWLKPTGKLIVLEHIHAKSKVGKLLYNLVNPLWKIIGEGCNLNRETDRSLKEAGFKVESEHYFTKGLGFYQAVFTVLPPVKM